jgi:formamidopyrimidine-DNA glycosylase
VCVPELPEVETVVRDLRPSLIGQTIASMRHSRLGLRRAWLPRWRSQLTGQTVTRVGRRGKWILIGLQSGSTLVIHLGMTGQLTAKPKATPLETHTHVVFTLAGGATELRFRDVRRFGSVTVLGPGAAVEDHLARHRLGPEPFAVELAYWRSNLAKTRRCMKAVLLDQRVVAGIGNIYADESLFAARLHPARPGRSLSATEVKRLARAVPDVLLRAIDKRGSTIRDYVGGSGLAGGFQDEFCVYGRTGRPCVRCGRSIVQVRMAGRSTHFCPRCQKG